MHKSGWLGVLLLLALPLSAAQATGWRKDSFDLTVINRHLRGKVIDHTANHGVDNRIWSRTLYQRRDLYIYVPPGFKTTCRYPLVIWLHGFGQDEKTFLHDVVPLLDKAICAKLLPPLIAVSPDGSVTGEDCCCLEPTYFLNSQLGDFEDYLLQDVWDFVTGHYPIRCEREAHVLAGVSMGGFAAYNIGIRHRDAFGTVIGLSPPLNIRWVDATGNYLSNFDPYNWGWRSELHYGHEVIARFAAGTKTVRLKHLYEPVFGLGPDALIEMSKMNPIEMVDRWHLRDGELAMYVAYGGRDEYNFDAQVESFLYLCKWRGLKIAVDFDPLGRHNDEQMICFLPNVIAWLAPKLAPYSPSLEPEPAVDVCADGACAPTACPNGECSIPPVSLPPVAPVSPAAHGHRPPPRW